MIRLVRDNPLAINSCGRLGISLRCSGSTILIPGFDCDSYVGCSKGALHGHEHWENHSKVGVLLFIKKALRIGVHLRPHTLWF